MKKILLITALIIGATYQTSSAQVSGSKFKPFSYEEMLAPVMAAQQKHDSNAAKVDALINYIFELRRQTDDKQFLDVMDSYYKKLKGFYSQNLASMDNQIREIQLGIMEEIDKYNRKVQQQSKEPKQSYQSDSYEKYKGLSGIQNVMNSAPLLTEPNSSAKYIGIIETGKVDIIKQVDRNYFYVKTLIDDKIEEGYLWAIWIK